VNYLAFDLGASSGKLFAAHFNGNVLSFKQIHRFANSPVALAQGLYWDFPYLYNEMLRGIGAALTELQGKPVSLGIDSFSNDFSFIDSDGALLAPMRSYRDMRTTQCMDQIFSQMSPQDLYNRSGNQIAPFNTLMQLASMKIQRKDAILDYAYRMLLLPDLLTYYLTGEIQAEYTVASVSQMLDFARRDWHEEILQAFHIPRNILPPIVMPGSHTLPSSAALSKATGLAPFSVIPVCSHDTASAFLGAPVSGSAGILSSGTWSLVGLETKNPLISEYGFRHNIANEGGLEGHHRLLCNVMGSWLLQQLQAEYASEGMHCDFNRLTGLAQTEKPLRWFVNVDHPDFFAPGDIRRKLRENGVRAYGDMPETMGQYARCICEGLAFKYRLVVEQLERLTGRTLPALHVVGGGSNDSFTCQLTANLLGRPVIAGPPDASAIGNVLVQMMADGSISSVEQGRQIVAASFPSTTYAPNDTGLWDEAYHHFCACFSLSALQ